MALSTDEVQASMATSKPATSETADWLWMKVGGLSPDVRNRLLSNAGLRSVPVEDRPIFDSHKWGFATRLPSVDNLLKKAEAGQTAQTAYTDALQSSRVFQSPDCVEAMAEAYQVEDKLEGLRGSSVLPATQEANAALDALRSNLKSKIKHAWSQEAVKRGVALIKSGDYDAAVNCYNQALQLDRTNCDALVARGAALANKQELVKARMDFLNALELDADHSNARKYLSITEERMIQLGMPLVDTRATAAGGTAAEHTQHTRSGHDARDDQSARAPEPQAGAPSPPTASHDRSASGSKGSSSSDSGLGDTEDGAMDVQKALKIMAKHYNKRSKKDCRKSKRKHHESSSPERVQRKAKKHKSSKNTSRKKKKKKKKKRTSKSTDSDT